MYSKEIVSAKEQEERGKFQKEGVKQKLKKMKVAHHVLLFAKIPWRREQLPTPVFCPGEFRGLY